MGVTEIRSDHWNGGYVLVRGEDHADTYTGGYVVTLTVHNQS